MRERELRVTFEFRVWEKIRIESWNCNLLKENYEQTWFWKKNQNFAFETIKFEMPLSKGEHPLSSSYCWIRLCKYKVGANGISPWVSNQSPLGLSKPGCSLDTEDRFLLLCQQRVTTYEITFDKICFSSPWLPQAWCFSRRIPETQHIVFLAKVYCNNAVRTTVSVRGKDISSSV